MKVDFRFTREGFKVTFTDASKEVPADSSYLWDFGVKGGSSSERNPEYTYTKEGFYNVTLTITPPVGVDVERGIATDNIAVSEGVFPTLSSSIYELIDSYIPDELIGSISYKDKRTYIEKWQLYMQPLVEPEVKIEDYNNEFKYPALVNQLIMEMAAYDWLITGIINLMRSTANAIENSSQGSEGGSTEPTANGNIKKITTGPTEVEFFEGTLSGDSTSSLAKTVTSALQPGGVIDNLKANICMLAERLGIYLPICRNLKQPVVPKVVNKRDPGILGGPNPGYVVKR